ncbi:hypothetical protein AGMMS49587_09030 [Spirochaetia bacterium]|nr:hypothetical protein AGMMS49587_09030 [Spirochaetia bacterium]
MKRMAVVILVIILSGCSTLNGMFDSIFGGLSNTSTGSSSGRALSSSDSNASSNGNPSFVRQNVGYSIRNSVDKVGKFIHKFSGSTPLRYDICQ